jgi:hypothetical protein
MTYTLIDSVTLTSSAANVSFTGISATGKGDLVISINAMTTVNNQVQAVQFNGDSGSNYNQVDMGGTGSSTYSYSLTNYDKAYSQTSMGTATKASYLFQISDFSATDKHKSFLIRGDRADSATSATAGRWASTSAITSILLYPGSGSYQAGGTFHLYQIVSE